MLEAFVLGFWLIWSADREIYPLSESLWFTIVAAFLRHLTTFELPLIDSVWLAYNMILWLYAAFLFIAVNRRNSSFLQTLSIAAVAGGSYFYLLQHLPNQVQNWLG